MFVYDVTMTMPNGERVRASGSPRAPLGRPTPNRDPSLRQLLGPIPPCADRPRPQDRDAGVASGQGRALFQAGQEAARAR